MAERVVIDVRVDLRDTIDVREAFGDADMAYVVWQYAAIKSNLTINIAPNYLYTHLNLYAIL